MTNTEKIDSKRMFSFEWFSKYRSLLMGLEMILIIFFHYAEDFVDNSGQVNRLISLFYNYISSSGVDAFLLFSGIGLYFSWKKNPNYRLFYKRRFGRVLIPYIIVAVIAWGLRDLVYMDLGIVQFIRDVTFISFFTQGEKWIWYILMISLCYLIYPYIFQIVETAQDEVTEQMRMMTLCTMCTVLAILLKLYHGELYENISIALYRFPAFFVGCLFGKITYEKRQTSTYWVWCLLVISMILVGPLELWKAAIIRIYVTAMLNISICLVVILMMERMEESKNRIVCHMHHFGGNILEWCGRYSLELYMVHVIVRKGMKYMGYNMIYIKNELLMLMITIILSLILKRVGNAFGRQLKFQ